MKGNCVKNQIIKTGLEKELKTDVHTVLLCVLLTARKAGLMATQQTFQNSPGAYPSMAWMSLLNLWIPDVKTNTHIYHKIFQ